MTRGQPDRGRRQLTAGGTEHGPPQDRVGARPQWPRPGSATAAAPRVEGRRRAPRSVSSREVLLPPQPGRPTRPTGPIAFRSPAATGPQHRCCFVVTLLVFQLRHGVGDDPGAGLDVGDPRRGSGAVRMAIAMSMSPGEVEVAHHSPHTARAAAPHSRRSAPSRAASALPTTSPAGKVATSTSYAVIPLLELADNGRLQVHDVAVAADRHEPPPCRRCRARHTRWRSLRERSTSMRCSARSLVSADRSVGQAHVVLGGLPTGSRPGDRVSDRLASGHLDERFGAGPDDVVCRAVRMRQAQEIHVRTGIGCPQGSIDVDRVGRAWVPRTVVRQRSGRRRPRGSIPCTARRCRGSPRAGASW
jgi:hypothetical protein